MLPGQVVDQVSGNEGGDQAQGRRRSDAGEHDERQPPVREEVTEDALEERPLQLDPRLRLVKAAVPPIHAGKPTQREAVRTAPTLPSKRGREKRGSLLALAFADRDGDVFALSGADHGELVRRADLDGAQLAEELIQVPHRVAVKGHDGVAL